MCTPKETDLSDQEELRSTSGGLNTSSVLTLRSRKHVERGTKVTWKVCRHNDIVCRVIRQETNVRAERKICRIKNSSDPSQRMLDTWGIVPRTVYHPWSFHDLPTYLLALPNVHQEFRLFPDLLRGSRGRTGP